MSNRNISFFYWWITGIITDFCVRIWNMNHIWSRDHRWEIDNVIIRSISHTRFVCTLFWCGYIISMPIIHYSDVIMSSMAFQITSFTIDVYSTVYSGADQRKHQSSASLAFVRGIHRWSVNSRTKGQLRGKRFHLMTSSCAKIMGKTEHYPTTKKCEASA